jgi:hypothetical protein
MVEEVGKECSWREAGRLSPSCAFAAHVAQGPGGFKDARAISYRLARL